MLLFFTVSVELTAGVYEGGGSWSACMMAGSESRGLDGAGGRSFVFFSFGFFSLAFLSVLVGGGGLTGCVCEGVSV